MLITYLYLYHYYARACIYRVFIDHADILCDKIFDPAVENGLVIDFHNLMLRYTMDTFVE